MINRSKMCEDISLMFLAHVSLPQAPGPMTSIIFDPPATFLFWLALTFSQDIPGVYHSACIGIQKVLCLDLLVPLSCWRVTVLMACPPGCMHHSIPVALSSYETPPRTHSSHNDLQHSGVGYEVPS